MSRGIFIKPFLVIALLTLAGQLPSALARDLEYSPNQGEIDIFVSPGEPTQVRFPEEVAGGYKKKNGNISLDRQQKDIVIFANQALPPTGESFIVRLTDGRSYSLRVKRMDDKHNRDEFINVFDRRGSILAGTDEDTPPYEEKKFGYAPATQVSGLMRELVLTTEFGKKELPGYTRSEKYRGQVVLNDGTMLATIDSIYIGPSLWGYVLDTANVLDQTQKLNPATFRLDGTRAVSASNWELAPRPFNVEQQAAGKDKTKVYIITKARK